MRSLLSFLLSFLFLSTTWAHTGAPYLESPSVCKNTWWVDAEFLYWKVYQGDMEYAASTQPGTFLVGNAKILDFQFKPGARLKAGYVNSLCCWDAAINYTYYFNHSQNSSSGTLFPSLNFFPSPVGGITTVTFAQSDWRLRFQYVDFDLGRPIWFADRFALHPHIGLRGAWIHQKGRVIYRGGNIATGTFSVDLKNHFNGCGMKAGLDSHFKLASCWSLFSDLSASLLWGRFHLQQVQNQVTLEPVNFRESFSQLAPSIQAAFGIAWQKAFGRWCPLLVISAAVEGQYWWRQNRFERFTDSVFAIHVQQAEDLGLLGLTLKGTVYF